MGSRKVMLIRHAEKGDPAAGIRAIDGRGADDPRGLSVRGWQRAGALVRWLAPLDGHVADPRLAKPSAVFAAAISAGHPSGRPAETVRPLAEALGLHVDDRHACEAEPQALLAAIGATHGPVLVCWRHAHMPALARALAPNAALPAAWPPDRYDVVWVFDAVDADGAGRDAGMTDWHFHQVAQRLLAGDGPHAIA